MPKIIHPSFKTTIKDSAVDLSTGFAVITFEADKNLFPVIKEFSFGARLDLREDCKKNETVKNRRISLSLPIYKKTITGDGSITGIDCNDRNKDALDCFDKESLFEQFKSFMQKTHKIKFIL